MIKNIISALFAACLVFTSCDDGRIYEKVTPIPQEGLTLRLTASITGMDTWPSNYSLVLASFAENSESAEKAVTIPSSANNAGETTTEMTGLKEDVSDLEFCIIDRLRSRVVSFKTISKADFNVQDGVIHMDLGSVDVSMYKAIQTSIFNAKCISCHGSQGSAPRNLFLTEGKSHADLVNVQSAANPDYKLVDPNNASQSLLPIILQQDGLLHHNHADILEARNKSEQVALIRDWINNGAKE